MRRLVLASFVAATLCSFAYATIATIVFVDRHSHVLGQEVRTHWAEVLLWHHVPALDDPDRRAGRGPRGGDHETPAPGRPGEYVPHD